MHEPNDTNRHIANNLHFYEEIELREVPDRSGFLSDWIGRASSHGPDTLVAVSVLIAMLFSMKLAPHDHGTLVIVGIVGVMLLICVRIKEVHRGPYPPRLPPNPP